LPRPQVRVPRSRGWLLPVLIIPLISYSVMTTVLLVLKMMAPPPPNPLEMFRDVDGDNPPAKRKKVFNWADLPLMALPPKLRVPLGGSLQIGDVRVTPQKVELRPIVWIVQGHEKDPNLAGDPSLVLYLHLENVSADVSYCPLDPHFDRRWEGKSTQNVPFTYLVLAENQKNQQRFFGGPARWDAERKETVAVGDPNDVPGLFRQNRDKELKPGEAMDTFVCTAP